MLLSLLAACGCGSPAPLTAEEATRAHVAATLARVWRDRGGPPPNAEWDDPSEPPRPKVNWDEVGVRRRVLNRTTKDVYRKPDGGAATGGSKVVRTTADSEERNGEDERP